MVLRKGGPTNKGEWLIKGTKHHKHNQSQSLKHLRRLSYYVLVNKYFEIDLSSTVAHQPTLDYRVGTDDNHAHNERWVVCFMTPQWVSHHSAV